MLDYKFGFHLTLIRKQETLSLENQLAYFPVHIVEDCCCREKNSSLNISAIYIEAYVDHIIYSNSKHFT